MRMLVLIALAACSGGAPSEGVRSSIPHTPAGASIPHTAPPSFNDRVVALTDSYPAAGFGGYAWPAAPGTAGTTRDLRRGEEVIAHGGDGNHCVGVTLEVFWRALDECPGGVEAALAADQIGEFKKTWYVPELGGHGAPAALVAVGLGERIARFEDARPGDFVQAWTPDQSQGHSMVFLGWEHDDAGAITGIRYWSSQPWTDGIGPSSMTLDDAGFDPAQVYIARASCR